MTIIEDDATIDLRTYVAESTLLGEGLPRKLFAAMVKSGEVNGVYSGFRLFVAREAVRAWLARNAPEIPLPRSLGKRKKLLTRVFSRTINFEVPGTDTPPATTPLFRAPEASMAMTPEPAPTSSPATKALAKMKTDSVVKKQKAPAKANTQRSSQRPTNAQIKALHARLQKTTTPEQRKAVYNDCGFHPVALARWFRMLDLKTIGAATAKPKRGRGRPRKEEKGTQANDATARMPKATAKGNGLKLVPGLSVNARETAIELLRALLAE